MTVREAILVKIALEFYKDQGAALKTRREAQRILTEFVETGSVE